MASISGSQVPVSGPNNPSTNPKADQQNYRGQPSRPPPNQINGVNPARTGI